MEDMKKGKIEKFEKDLESLINQHSIDSMVNIPDYILAGMLCNILRAIGIGIYQRDQWDLVKVFGSIKKK